MVVAKLTDLMPDYSQCNNNNRFMHDGSIPHRTNSDMRNSHRNLSSAPVDKSFTSTSVGRSFTSASTRKSSTSSSDSLDSDGQLCTEDHCVMDSKKRVGVRTEVSETKRQILINSVHSSNSLQGFRNRKHAVRNDSNNKPQLSGTPHKVETLGKLCRSCGGEMQKLPLPESQDGQQVLKRCRKAFKQSLSKFVPCWLSEPEYMVHPRPRDKSDDILVHSHADSLFSTSSGFTNYYGILNLGLILLVLGNARLFLENIIKYGILINLSFMKWFFLDPYNWPNLLLTLSIAIYPAIALVTEKALSKISVHSTPYIVMICYRE